MSQEKIPIAGILPPKVLRYRMSPIQSKVQGSKTIIENLHLIARHLHRSPEELCKFFGLFYSVKAEIKSLSVKNKGVPSPPVTVLKTVRTKPELQDALSEFIEWFVLCPCCRLPETRYAIELSSLHFHCSSCHASQAVEAEKYSKLTQFILIEQQKKQSQLKREGKSLEEEETEKYWGLTNKNPLIFISPVGLMMEPKLSVEPNTSSSSSSSEEEKEEDSSAAIKVPSQAVEDCSDQLATDDCAQRFKSYLANHPAATVKEQVEELKHLQTMASLRPADRCIIFLGAVFSDQAIAQNEVEKHHDMLTALAASEIQQRHLLAATEWFCGALFPTLTRLFPKLLMQLYDAEVVEEDTFLAWAADTTRNEFTADPSLI